MSKVSIILPVYNVQDYLETSIQSVLSQTHTSFELIIVNDGSTDSSLEICRHYANTDNRIKLINKSNGGLSSARNAGLDVADGDYVYFLDSDDYIDTNTIQIMVQEKEKLQVGCLVAGHINVKEDGIVYNERKKSTRIYSGKNFVHCMVNPRRIGAYAWGKLFDRNLFSTLRFPVGLLYEDIMTIPWAIYDLDKVAYISTPLYMYRQREGSILNSYSEKRSDEILAYCKLIDFADEKHDAILAWYAAVNAVRSYLEVHHRYKVHGFDVAKLEKEYRKMAMSATRRIIWPFQITSKQT